MPLIAPGAGIYLMGGTAYQVLLRNSQIIWHTTPDVAPETRPLLADTDAVAFSAHSLLDTATGITGAHGGNFDEIWNGTIHQTYWGGSYLSYRWSMNGPDRTAPAYSAFMFTEMADFSVGYADPASAEGISTLQHAYWHVLNAQQKGAEFAVIYWAWSPPGTTVSQDNDTMAKQEYLRQWLMARPEITIPVYGFICPPYIREVLAINETYNPGWAIHADEVGHLNSSWQEVDESLSALVWMMFRGVKYPDDVGRSAFLQALIDMGWDMLNAYACTGFGGATVVTPFSVSSDPLPNPAPMEGGALAAPTVVTQPSTGPATPALNELVTLFIGAASGNPTPTATWSLTLDGVDISSQVSGQMDLTLTEEGDYVFAVTWTNSQGSVAAISRTFTLSAGAPAAIQGGEGEIVITSMTSPTTMSVAGGEGQIILSGA